MISLLRSAFAGPRRGPVGALAILTVIVGVVTMHSMSGSPTSHGHAVPHETSVAAVEQAGSAQAATGPVLPQGQTQGQTQVLPQAPDGHADDEGSCCEGCGGHDAAMAMCLMILVALLGLVAPVRRLLWRAPLELAMSLTPALAVVRDLAAPSLHDLCISRT